MMVKSEQVEGHETGRAVARTLYGRVIECASQTFQSKDTTLEQKLMAALILQRAAEYPNGKRQT